ncbi:MAG: hypothetical protein HKN68_01540 [Saprospiraceae bacterium]|nr:hypothetical protein [Saprospiraceae bacterium]
MLVKKISSGQRLDLRKVEEIGFLHVRGRAMVGEIINQKFDAIIVDEEDTLTEIRSREELYLYPIFSTLESKQIEDVDGVFDPLTPLFSVGKVRMINQAFNRFKSLNLPEDPSQRALVKISRYLVSRGANFSPYRSATSPLAYSWKLLQDLSGESNTLSMIKMMEQFSHQNFFKRKVVDKINLCHKCDSAYLNFSECCTQCSSIDLYSEELVHHFRCAYVGPLSDFKKEDHLECPKCNHKLKHIGIDYDKPSEINTCNTCNYSSQETTMKAKCVTCGHDNTLDALRTYHVCEYTPTDMARVKAAEAFKTQEVKVEEYGFDPAGIITYSVYQILSNHEKQKLGLYSNDLFTLSIEVKEGVLRNLNQVHRNNLLMELSRITKPYLNDRDIITINPDQDIECMLIDYKIKDVLEVIKILEYNLNKMLMDNSLTQGKSITVSYHQLIQS